MLVLLLLPLLHFTANRPKPETLQRKALERKAAKHSAKGTRGAKRLELSGGGGRGGKGGSSGGGGKAGGSRGGGGAAAAAGGRRGGAPKPRQRQAKFK